MVFITTTVVDWTPAFSSNVCARIVADQLLETASHNSLSIAAYVIMPSHIHVLVGFPAVEKLSSAIQGFKSLSSRRIEPRLSADFRDTLRIGGTFCLWKPRFDDLVIWSERQFMIKVDYIHHNPVKAGLVESAVDYEFSSASDWLTEKRGRIPIDKDWSWVR